MTPLEQLRKEAMDLWMKTDSIIMPKFLDDYLGKAFKLGYEESESDYLKNAVHSTDSPCPLTNSSHEKALVRVVEKHERIYEKGEFVKLLEGDFIQVLCGCGHIISEAEIKSK